LTSDPRFSVVIAVFNEADNVEAVTQEVLRAAAPLGQFELIYVDDGSTDLTADRVQELRASGNAIRLLRHDRCCGKTAALITGVTAARAPWIVTMDGDGQDSADDVPRLLELAWAGDALACWLPVAAWLIEARVDLVGVLTALAVVPLLIATLLLLQYGKVIRAVACAGTATLVLFASVYGYQLPHLQTIWMSPRIAQAVAHARPCARTIVATAPYIEPSLVFVLGTGTELTDVKGVAEHLRRDPACGLGLVGAQERSSFLSLLNAAHLIPRELDHIRGINYSSGKWLELTLYAVSPAG
jgi:hypothetical protein